MPSAPFADWKAYFHDFIAHEVSSHVGIEFFLVAIDCRPDPLRILRHTLVLRPLSCLRMLAVFNGFDVQMSSVGGAPVGGLGSERKALASDPNRCILG